MISSDQRVKHTLAVIARRPELPLKNIVVNAIDILRTSPMPRPRSDSIIKSRLLLSNNRTKLIEYRINIAMEISIIAGARDDLIAFIGEKYQNYLGSAKNQKSRDAIVYKALTPIHRRIRKLESALDAINQVISDLDVKSYGINNTIEALKLGERE